MIAFDRLIIVAQNLGSGTSRKAAFVPLAICKVLRLPANLEPIAITALNYPAETWK